MAKPKPTAPSRSYTLTTDPNTGKISANCYKDPAKDCIIHNLWVTDKLTTFHDAYLSRATREINEILGNINKKNMDRKRELSFIIVENRPFLVWTHHGSIGPNDDPAEVRRALGLKMK
jgi:hypothetical protein